MSLQVTSRKYYNQFKNGRALGTALTTFTPYLLGNVGNRYRRDTEVEVRLATELEGYDWDVSSTQIICNDVNFITLGWVIGDTFELYGTVGGNTYNYASFTILNVTANAITITGTFSYTGSASTELTMFMDTPLLGVRYNSNLIENNEAANYVSKVDETTTRAYSVQLTGAEYTGSSVVAAAANGPENSWKMSTDSVTVQSTQRPATANNYTYKFVISEIFTILPLFDNATNLDAGISPATFLNNLCLRHVCRISFTPSLMSPVVVHTIEDSATPTTYGNTGYYNERFNGYSPSNYAVESITLEVGGSEVDYIEYTEDTDFEIVVTTNGTAFSSGNTKYVVNVAKFATEQDLMLRADENFLFDSYFGVTGAAAGDGDNGILTGVEGAIVSGKLVITGKISYTAGQQALLNDGDKFLISVSTEDYSAAIADSDNMMLVAEVVDFYNDTDVYGLIALADGGYSEHPFEYNDDNNRRTNYAGWVEDGVLLYLRVYSDLSLDAFIKSFTLRLVSYNSGTGNFFELYKKTFDLSGYPLNGSVQEIFIDETANFKLATGDQFNWIKFTRDTLVGDKQYYDIYIGHKHDWRDYVANANVDGVFFDSTKLNNNLNYLSSNYSGKEGYVLKHFIEFEMSDDAGATTTQYRFRSPDLEIYEYDEDENAIPLWTGAITTESEDSGLNLNGNLSTTENTIVTAVFEPTSGSIVTTAIYGIIRIEEYQAGGLTGIYEISTQRAYPTNNYLIPLSGETLCKITIASDSVTLEAMVDVTKIVSGATYKLSAKIGSSCDDIKGDTATDSVVVVRPHLIATIDGVFPDVGAVSGISVSAPLSLEEIAIALNACGTSYVFTDVTTTQLLASAPASGASYNGDVITLDLKNSIGIVLQSVTFTLAGGVDTVDCPPFIPNVNNYKETEDGEIKFTEDDEVKILE